MEDAYSPNDERVDRRTEVAEDASRGESTIRYSNALARRDQMASRLDAQNCRHYRQNYRHHKQKNQNKSRVVSLNQNPYIPPLPRDCRSTSLLTFKVLNCIRLMRSPPLRTRRRLDSHGSNSLNWSLPHQAKALHAMAVQRSRDQKVTTAYIAEARSSLSTLRRQI